MKILDTSNNYIVKNVAVKSQVKEWQADNVISLVNEDNTVHFIARYRKEKTGNLDENQIRKIIDEKNKIDSLIKAKENAIKNIDEQGKLTAELNDSIVDATSLSEVEDIYAHLTKERKRLKQILQLKMDLCL